jgi:hypothetical protein
MLESTGAGPEPEPSAAVGLVYFASQGVYVTDRLFVCAGRKVALVRLTNVHTVRSPVPGIAVNAAIATGTVAIVLVVAGSLLDTAGWIGGLVVLAVPALVLCAGLARRRSYELWADVTRPNVTGDDDGTPVVSRVLLLRSDDAERYHQICRALVRAQEHGRS